MTLASERWRTSLAAWAIPDEILASSEQSPWIHPPALFDVPESIAPTLSHERAREAVPRGGTVVDVGCGGGVAALAVAPPAATVVGVDHQEAMLTMFRRNALRRSLTCQTIEGLWPAVASETPVGDVVTAHHVVYNVGDIVPFLRALDEHARYRVVLEMPDQHPLSSLTSAWEHFWHLERPVDPTPSDLLEVLDEMGVRAQRERWTGEVRPTTNLDEAAHFMRIRLCLSASRDDEVRDFMLAHPTPTTRELSTVWWDTSPSTQE